MPDFSLHFVFMPPPLPLPKAFSPLCHYCRRQMSYAGAAIFIAAIAAARMTLADSHADSHYAERFRFQLRLSDTGHCHADFAIFHADIISAELTFYAEPLICHAIIAEDIRRYAERQLPAAYFQAAIYC
jgi:hypothetical protein